MKFIKSFCLLLILFFCIQPIYAQDFVIPKFGESVEFDKLSNIQLKDTSAEAVILFDIGSIRYRDQNAAYITRRTRIMILKKKGYKWARITIPLYIENKQHPDQLVGLKALSFNEENGKIVKTELDKKDIFRENYNKNYDLIKSEIPNIREGTVIEFEYTYSTDYVINLPEWHFQYDIPVLWSEFVYHTSPYLTYMLVPTGYLPFYQTSKTLSNSSVTIDGFSYTETIFRFVMKDVPAFKNEPFITSENDYKSKISLQLSGIQYPGTAKESYIYTWESLTEKLLLDYQIGECLGDRTYKEEAVEMTKDIPENEPLKRAKKIYEFVQKNFDFNGISSLAARTPPKKLVELKTGNCTEIHVLLCNMLNHIGIDARMVILSERDHGKIDLSYPLLNKFNYSVVLVKFGNEQYLLDATDKALVFGMLPAQCINGQGLILEKVKDAPARFVILDQPVSYKYRTNITITFDMTKNECTLFNNVHLQGYAALEARNQDLDEEKIKNIFQLTTMQDLEIRNIEDNSKPVDINFKSIQSFEKGTGQFYIDLPYMHQDLQNNPFKNIVRNFPIDFTYKKEYIYLLNIEIPEGYQLEAEIDPVSVKIPGNLLELDIKTNSISEKFFQVQFQLKINKPVISESYYADIKAIFDKVVGFAHKVIILKKK